MIWYDGGSPALLALTTLLVALALTALFLVVVRSTSGARKPALARRAVPPPRPSLEVVDEVDEGQFVHETGWPPAR